MGRKPRDLRGNRARLGQVAALLAAALASIAAQAAPPRPGSRYVAMGSSFASGPDLGPPRPGTPARCTRSAVSYPVLLAQRLHLDLADETCSGATTEHVLGPWGELPPQIEAVTAETRLVTATIGGNDIYYSSGVIAAACAEGRFMLAGELRPCPPRKAIPDEAYASLERNLARIAAEVRRRAPGARLIFVEYPALIPARLCPGTPLSAADAAESRRKAARLAQITERVAARAGVEVIRTDSLGRGHTACSRQPWINGFPAGSPGVDGIAWHPTRAGMRAMAGLVEARLQDR